MPRVVVQGSVLGEGWAILVGLLVAQLQVAAHLADAHKS